MFYKGIMKLYGNSQNPQPNWINQRSNPRDTYQHEDLEFKPDEDPNNEDFLDYEYDMRGREHDIPEV